MEYAKYSYPYVNEFYSSLSEVYSHGKTVFPRGQETKEILQATIRFEAEKSLFTCPTRDLNFSFLFAENLWYLTGRNNLSLLNHYNKNYKNFADEGILRGAYGPMFMEQLSHVINSLRLDQDSRQAVISLWRPNPQDAKDKPCTLSFHFMIRDDKLNLHATMRSNDVIWGQNYDAPSFSLLLMVVAGILKVRAGDVFLTVSSLHLYERHYELAKKLLDKRISYYDKPVNLIPCEVDSLEHHLECVDACLSAHFKIQDGQWPIEVILNENIPAFYRQHIGAMAFYNYKKMSDQDVGKVIAYLERAHSPLSIIFHDTYKNHIRKSCN